MCPISRRDFLKTAGVCVAAGAGLVFLGTRAPAVTLPDISYGEASMTSKVLIAYATRSGSTAEVAAAMGEALAKKGVAVDVKPVRQVTSLNDYRAVVVGSAVRMGAWLPEAVNFVKNNQAQLSRQPVAYFTLHLQNLGDSEEERTQRMAYTAPVRQALAPAIEAFFAGKIELARLSFFERMLSKAMKAVDEDRRDWRKITAWAEELPAAWGL